MDLNELGIYFTQLFNFITGGNQMEKTTVKTNVKLSAPWDIFYREMQAMFGEDPEVELDYIRDEDRGEHEIKLRIASVDKAEALTKLLPETKTFGNITVKITVIPPNSEEDTKDEIYKKAFKGNPVVDHIDVVLTPAMTDLTYILFKKKVVQFYADNTRDPNGLKSTLYQDIAMDIFPDETADVSFCTSTLDDSEGDEFNW